MSVALSIDKDIKVKTAFPSNNIIINYPIGDFFADVVTPKLGLL